MNTYDFTFAFASIVLKVVLRSCEENAVTIFVMEVLVIAFHFLYGI